MGEGESVFFKGVTIGRGRAPHPRVWETQTVLHGQRKMWVGMDPRGSGRLEDFVKTISRWTLKTDLGLLAFMT